MHCPAIQEFKGREAGGRLGNLSVGKEQVWQQCVPVLANVCCCLAKQRLQGLVKPFHETIHLRVIGSGVAKLGHTGARALATGGCAPPVQALLPNVQLSIANWALKVRKGVEIELRSLAIRIFRITRSVCSPDLDVDSICVCRRYYSDLTLRARRFVYSKGIVEVLQYKATVWPKVAPESTKEAQKFQNFGG